MRKIKLLFFGSGDFSVPVVNKLFDDDSVNIVGVVTQPDKAAGRRKVLRPTPLKAALQKSSENFKFFQPEKISKEYEEMLKATDPDLIVVVDYGQLLPEKLLNSPKYLSLNVHASLLPKFRGAAPIQAAILEGVDITGVSIMKMTPGLDDGPVLKQVELVINPHDDAITLEKKLAALGALTLVEVLPDWTSGELKPDEQNHAEATYAPKSMIKKSSAEIKRDTSVEEIDRMVRAFIKWPVAWVRINYEGSEKRVKLYNVTVVSVDRQAGAYGGVERDGRELILKMKDGALKLNELQLEGKKRDTGKNYLFLAGKAQII